VSASASNEKGESYRRLSYSSATESDDFSLWSDTGDIAEQLANDEDPFRIELDPLTSRGQRLTGSGRGGGRKKKKVVFLENNNPEKRGTPLSINKEDICIPEPPPRQISKVERLLALIMAPNDPQSAKVKGLVGKPLLYEMIPRAYVNWA
jgi:hypothetical protein